MGRLKKILYTRWVFLFFVFLNLDQKEGGSARGILLSQTRKQVNPNLASRRQPLTIGGHNGEGRDRMAVQKSPKSDTSKPLTMGPTLVWTPKNEIGQSKNRVQPCTCCHASLSPEWIQRGTTVLRVGARC